MAENRQTDEQRTPVAFVAMCFDNRLQHVYHRVVKPVLESHGFICQRADEMKNIGMIIEQIESAINNADLVVCDLTFENPNVFYELGITHVLRKPTVMISQSAANIPFDVRHWRVIPYEDTKLGLLDLREALADFLTNMFPNDQGPYKHQAAPTMPAALDELETHRMALFANSLDFKRHAIKFLGDYRDKASYQKIEMIAIGDHNSDIVRDAMTALLKIDPEKARPVLVNNGLRKQRDFLVRERVVSLLGNYDPDDELLHLMISQLGDSSWGVRCEVCQVLGRWGKREAAGALQNMVSDSEPLVRLAAAEALERLHEVKPTEEKAKEE